MDRNGFLTVFLCIFIVVEASNASLLSKHRILIGEPQNDHSTVPVKDSPVSSPPPPPPPPSPPPSVSSSGGNGSVPKADDDPSKHKTDSLPPAKTPKADPGPKGLNNKTKTDEGKDPNKEKKDPNPTPDKESKEDPSPLPATTPKQDPNSNQLKDKPGSASAPPEGGKVKNKEDPREGGKVKNKEDSPEGGKVKSKEIEKKEKNNNVTNSPNADKESCDGISKTCKVKDVVVACIKSFDSGSKKMAILVQNVGGNILKAKVSAENTSMDLEIAKHQNKKVNISLDIDKSTKITVNTGNRECELHMDPPVSDGNFFLRLPSYEKVVTPINGAYCLIVTVLIFGGTWAFCKARKRKQRTGGGVQYQELEMGLPESVSATAVETAEGWDQGWDDDWDGANAVKSPGAHLVGSISANGLTSRSANKDGWENDWDD